MRFAIPGPLTRRSVDKCVIPLVIFGLVLGVQATASVRAAVWQPGRTDIERIDRWIEGRLAGTDTPGAAWAIIHRDQVVHQQVYGNDGDGHPITPQTPFLLGSISKPITALAVMQLVERGEVTLSSPVQQYLPWFELADADVAKRITIEHLLMHTSGISESSGLAAADRFDNEPGGVERTVRSLADTEPVRDPGAEHEYSDANYMILGAVVEAVSGQSFGEYLHEHILDPLEMVNAVTTEEEVRIGNLPPGHRYYFRQPSAFDSDYDTSGVPYGYLGASLEDVSRFTIAQLNGGRYESATVLSPAAIEASHAGPGEPSARNYAYGWRDDELSETGTRIVWHTGATPGYVNIVIMLPDLELAAIVLQNIFSPLMDAELNGAGFGAATILAGGDPDVPAADLMYRNLLIIGLAVSVVLLVAVVWSVARLIRQRSTSPNNSSRRRIVSRTILWVLGAGALAATFTFLLPPLFGADLNVVLLFTPDLGHLIVAMILLSLALAALRLILGVRAFLAAGG